MFLSCMTGERCRQRRPSLLAAQAAARLGDPTIAETLAPATALEKCSNLRGPLSAQHLFKHEKKQTNGFSKGRTRYKQNIGENKHVTVPSR